MSVIIPDIKREEPELAGPWTISHQTPVPVHRPEHVFDFAKPTDLVREISSFYYFHDPILTWDPVVVAAIREFDPTIIPCFCKKVYRWPTGGEAVLSYFAILREKYPTVNEKEPFRVKRCSCSEHANLWPNIEEVVFGGDPPAPGWPESFIPCDARMAQRLKRIYWFTDRAAKDIAKDVIEADEAKRAAGEAKLQSDFNDRIDEEWDHLMNTVRNLTERDIANMHLARREAKPSVYVNQSPTEPASPVQGA
jgi:hypothetical protein